MMSSKRLSLTSPAILLGLPLPDTTNPYIAVPISRINLNLELRKCMKPRLIIDSREGEGNTLPRLKLIRGFLEEFWLNMTSGMKLEYCTTISVEVAAGRPGPSGLYASTTVGLVYALARFHGETLNEYEILELARLSDPSTLAPWSIVVDALRYSVLKGSIVAYRSEEEATTLASRLLDSVHYNYLRRVGDPVLNRNNLGDDLYNLIVKLVGSLVLDAAIRLRESQGSINSINPHLRVHRALVKLFWDIPSYGSELPVPGLGEFFEYYIVAE